MCIVEDGETLKVPNNESNETYMDDEHATAGHAGDFDEAAVAIITRSAIQSPMLLLV